MAAVVRQHDRVQALRSEFGEPYPRDLVERQIRDIDIERAVVFHVIQELREVESAEIRGRSESETRSLLRAQRNAGQPVRRRASRLRRASPNAT